MPCACGLEAERPLLLNSFLRSMKDDPQPGIENGVRQDTGDENIADCLSCHASQPGTTCLPLLMPSHLLAPA